ncbi:hypothetical protein BURK_002270 [Burkholderia sp. SJ98]|nr:hypothetical protein BURK_002270 [Burkholderia sp. SJ98]
MIPTPDESEVRLLDRRQNLSSQAILAAHFVFGCAGRQKEIKKSALMVQVISRLESLFITVASMWDRVSQAWRDCRRRKE